MVQRPAEFALLFHVFHSDYAKWLTKYTKPRDVIVRELKGGMRSGELRRGDTGLTAALLLGMAIRLGFFERQKLVASPPDDVEEELWSAGSAVLSL